MTGPDWRHAGPRAGVAELVAAGVGAGSARLPAVTQRGLFPGDVSTERHPAVIAAPRSAMSVGVISHYQLVRVRMTRRTTPEAELLAAGRARRAILAAAVFGP
jgi:hypothetical protein